MLETFDYSLKYSLKVLAKFSQSDTDVFFFFFSYKQAFLFVDLFLRGGSLIVFGSFHILYLLLKCVAS